MALLARDLMNKDVGIVNASASLADLERAFVDAEVSGFPVVERGIVVGVVSRADVLRQLGDRMKPRLSTFYADLGAFEAEEALETFAEASARGARRLEELRVEDLMTHSVFAVEPDTPVEDVARTLAEHRIHRVLVTDDGTLVGIVSALDVVRQVAEGTLSAE